jgi:hypothetical protein
MPGFPNPRVRPVWRHVHRLPERRPSIVPPEDDMQALFNTLAEQLERGAALAREHAAGVFGPDDEDSWTQPDRG